MRLLLITTAFLLAGCGQMQARPYWELYMDGETLNRTFGPKGWCREQAMRMEEAYPSHTFECVQKWTEGRRPPGENG